MRYFLTINCIRRKFSQIALSYLLNSRNFIKVSLKLKKNKLISLSHFNLDFTFQHYVGNIISKKNKFFRNNVMSVRIRNSRYGFEICYLPSNPFARQKILLTKFSV